MHRARAQMLSVSVHQSRLLSAGRAATDDDDIRVCSAILASVVSLMLLCGILSMLPSPGAIAATKAYVVLGVAAVMLVLMLIAWLVAPGIRALTAPRAPAPAPVPAPAATPAPVQLARRLCACGLADAAGAVAALPAFPYGAAAAGDDEASASPQRPRRSCVLCAVCLEDVRAGEMVRQLPACRHLFHVGCVDAWLRAHRTCPLCRCELPPRKATTTAAVVAAAAAEALPLPPV